MLQRLDSFDHHVDAERIRQLQGAGNRYRTAGRGVQLVDEHAVQLYFVEGQRAQALQGGVPGTEVINGQAAADHAQPHQVFQVHRRQCLGVGFGHFKTQAGTGRIEPVQALKKDPSKVVIGSGGTVGSQDWMQTALIAKAAGINPRDLRYVALEGGGEIATALLGGHIQVGSTDISDSMPHIQSGDMRLLAVFANERLDEPEMKDIPTAKEQGYDIVWPVVRGFYLGPKVSDADYAWWKDAFDKLLVSEEFATLRNQRELFPFSMTGPELDTYVKKQVADYKILAHEFGLIQ